MSSLRLGETLKKLRDDPLFGVRRGSSSRSEGEGFLEYHSLTPCESAHARTLSWVSRASMQGRSGSE
jgi:hypothetical protein